MTAVSVSQTNTRITGAEAADSASWVDRGGGAGSSQSGDVVLQGSESRGRRVDAAIRGYSFDVGAGNELDVTDGDMLAWWVAITTFGGINDISVVVGSSTTASDLHEVVNPSGGLDYAQLGGFMRFWVDPQRTPEATEGGGATLTAARYFGGEFDMQNVAGNAVNCFLDAIDKGAGLTLIGGDGADTDGTWQDFVTFDGGNNANLFGFAFQDNSGNFVAYGNHTVGSSGQATEFTGDPTHVINWPGGLWAAGWSVLTLDLQNASTVIDQAELHIGKGTGGQRPDITAVGTSGSGTLSGTFRNFRNVTLTSGMTVTGTLECIDLTQGGATLSSCIIGPETASGVALIDDPTFTAMSGVRFVQRGSGHAIEITSPGTYSLDAILFQGFGGTPGSNPTPSSGALDAMVYNNSGGAVTLQVTNGGTVPSVRNGASATTTVEANITITFQGFTTGTEIRVYRVSDGGEEDGIESATAPSFAATLQASTAYNIVAILPGKEPIRLENRSFTVSQVLNLNQQPDLNYLNQ